MIKFLDVLELQQQRQKNFMKYIIYIVVIIPTNKKMIRKDWNDQIFRTESRKK